MLINHCTLVATRLLLPFDHRTRTVFEECVRFFGNVEFDDASLAPKIMECLRRVIYLHRDTKVPFRPVDTFLPPVYSLHYEIRFQGLGLDGLGQQAVNHLQRIQAEGGVVVQQSSIYSGTYNFIPRPLVFDGIIEIYQCIQQRLPGNLNRFGPEADLVSSTLPSSLQDRHSIMLALACIRLLRKKGPQAATGIYFVLDSKVVEIIAALLF